MYGDIKMSGNESVQEIVIVPTVETVKAGYWAPADEVSPAINAENEAGQLKNGSGEPIAQFETAAQAVMSLYYARFAPVQILQLMPQAGSYSEKDLIKIITNKCNKKVRYVFVSQLTNAAPRKLTVEEFKNIVGVVGQPGAKVKSRDIVKIRAMINADIENIDMLKPTERKQSSRVPGTHKQMSKADIEEVMNSVTKTIEMANMRIAQMNEKYIAMRTKYDELPQESERKTLARLNVEAAEEKLRIKLKAVAKMESYLDSLREQYNAL